MSEIGQIVVDASGKAEIPETMCEQLGLVPGTRLLVETDLRGEIRLRLLAVTDQRANEKETNAKAEGLVRENGILVFKGEVLENLEKVIESERDARIQEILETFRV